MKKKYMGYIFPSMLSFLLTGIYSIVDGIFVGRAMGDPGLAAINIAWPLVALIISLGTGIGMGGAIYYSISKAEKQDARAREFTAGALWVMILTSIILTLAVFGLNGWLLSLLGAEGQLRSLGDRYWAGYYDADCAGLFALS